MAFLIQARVAPTRHDWAEPAWHTIDGYYRTINAALAALKEYLGRDFGSVRLVDIPEEHEYHSYCPRIAIGTLQDANCKTEFGFYENPGVADCYIKDGFAEVGITEVRPTLDHLKVPGELYTDKFSD
tara:strand:- start:1295 stop:1675 length:381 start_codon:yes stop_codon:yes gene_type:complete